MATKYHGLFPFKGVEHLCTFDDFFHMPVVHPGRFARLFSALPPLYIDPLVLHELGLFA